MLCEKCKKNEATGYCEGAHKGVKTVMHLCTRCLLDNKKELFGGLDMFSGFVGGQGAGKAEKLRCGKCGTDIRSVAKSLFVGCAECYGQLSAQLNPIIKNIQGSTMHVGVSPSTTSDIKSEIELLRRQLYAAVSEERFEDAVALSGRLKSLCEAEGDGNSERGGA